MIGCDTVLLRAEIVRFEIIDNIMEGIYYVQEYNEIFYYHSRIQR